MTRWAAMSINGSCENGDGWYFNPADEARIGFRATDQPGPRTGDWGRYVLMPQTGELPVTPDARKWPYDADGRNDGRSGFEWLDKLGYVPDRKIGYSVSAR